MQNTPKAQFKESLFVAEKMLLKLVDDSISLVRKHQDNLPSAIMWRRGGLVVSPSDFRSGGRWFEPSLCHRVVFLDKKLYSTLSLFTQVNKWVPAIIMLGGNLVMD